MKNRLLDELDYQDRLKDIKIQAESDFTSKACKLYLDLVNTQSIQKSILNYAILKQELRR